MGKDNLQFNSKTIHGGQQPDKGYGAVMPPVYLTSTYAQSTPGGHQGYEYSRTHNPTRTALEAALASIEDGTHAFCFGSGMAAIDAVIKLLSPGDEVISTNDLYGGSYRIFTKIFEDFGIGFHFVDMQDPANVAAKINAKTKLIWVETPTNPMMNVVDIEAMHKLVADKDILLAVDNTFASPYLQQPLTMGADIVMHSATKYLGGHSDVILGALVVRDASLGRTFVVYPKRQRCGLWSSRCLFGVAGYQNPACPYATPLRKRRKNCPFFSRSSQSGQGLLAGLSDPSQSRGGQTTDEWIWGYDFVCTCR